MGKAIKAITKPILGGLSEQVKPIAANREYFDISKEAKPAQEAYQNVLQQSQAAAGAVNPFQTQALTQLGRAATGQGPSLAEAQLKAAQDRTLAQQLAAVQAGRNRGALAQRELLRSQGAMGQDLAQQAAIARLQERDQFLNQANLAQQALRNDITGKLNVDVMPKQMLQNWELGRVQAVNQAQAANAAQQNQMMGALLSAAGSGIASAASGGAGGFLGGLGSAPAGKKDGGQVTHKYKKGGKVKGPGSERSDSIPTMLSNKEFVVKASIAKKPAMLKHLMAINSGELTEKQVKAMHEDISEVLKRKHKKKDK